MNITPPINVVALIDQSKISVRQVIMLSLCGLTVLMDGFDVQIMGYVAPAILQDWKIDAASMGPVFGAGIAGLLLGSIFLGMLADKVGRRPILIAATFSFAICMLLTTQVSTVNELLIIRFITGLGLGAILPNAMALVSEYSPLRKRVTILMVVSMCFTVGAVIAGFIAAAMIPIWGWKSVFFLGGAIPLLLAVVMLFYLPESLQFLVLREKHALIGKWLTRAGTHSPDSGTKYCINEVKEKGSPVIALFRDGRARMTLLLWGVNILNLINLNFLASWLPTISREAGLALSAAVLVGTSLQIGGSVGAIALAIFIQRTSFRRVLIPCFLVAGASIFFIGRPELPIFLLFLSVAVTGVCVLGGQSALNALAASYYPASLRSTGIGWSLGVGRLGSIVGPVLGGELIRLNWPTSTIFIVVAIPAILSAVAIWGMEGRPRPAYAIG